MDNLEKFFKENKDSFDSQDAPQHLWANIEQALEKDKKVVKVITIRHTTLWRVAAAAVLLLVGGYFILQLYLPSGIGKNNLADSENRLDTQKMNPELIEAEKYYASMIESKKEEIKKYANENPEVYGELEQGLNTLDSAYSQLKSELSLLPENQEKVEQAMINNLKTRIEILNQQLIILEKIQKIKNKKEDEYKEKKSINA